RQLAQQLNMEFYDSDQEIEKRTGADVGWVFDVEGEDGFRNRELERMINTRQIDLAVVFQKDKILRWSARPILEEQLFLIGSHAL
ncbi:hypothetical protein MJM99_31275, partial [Salmonella enterica subsp. enterica serovar Kentucky]|nr:hypothetical protein [Salmonella enterica subsp. enterica serovar Kentucky]